MITRVMDGTRLQYLRAMGVDIWIRRSMHRAVSVPIEEPQKFPLDNGSSAVAVCSGASVAETKSALEILPQIFRKNVAELTRWLSAQHLMPVIVDGVSVTTIGGQDAQLLVLSHCTAANKSTHQPISGRATYLLKAMLRAIGESFESVLQAKLDPSQPSDNAVNLRSLLEGHSFKAILLLVNLPSDESAELLSALRDKTSDEDCSGARIFVSYHPDYLVTHPQTKALAWEDLKAVRDYLANQ